MGRLKHILLGLQDSACQQAPILDTLQARQEEEHHLHMQTGSLERCSSKPEQWPRR